MAVVWILGVSGLFLAIGLVIAGAGAVRLRRWRTMKHLDPVGPMAAEPGLQELEGTARAVDGTVTAPFTGAESLVCTHKVQRYDQGDGSNWHTIDSETRTAPFEVESPGSSVAVDGQGAQHLLTEEFALDTKRAEEIPDRIAAYMRHEHDIDDLNASLDVGPMELDQHRFRLVEERLDVGEEVYVLGTVRRDPSRVPEGADARLAINPRDRTWKDRLLGDPFVISDTGEQEAIRRQYESGRNTTLFGLIFAGFAAAVLVLTVAG